MGYRKLVVKQYILQYEKMKRQLFMTQKKIIQRRHGNEEFHIALVHASIIQTNTFLSNKNFTKKFKPI